MPATLRSLVIRSRAEYRSAIHRANMLRSLGATAETNRELAEIEGAIAVYVAKPGQPEWRKARPGESGSDAM
jgi:hypothetical protein